MSETPYADIDSTSEHGGSWDAELLEEAAGLTDEDGGRGGESLFQRETERVRSAEEEGSPSAPPG